MTERGRNVVLAVLFGVSLAACSRMEPPTVEPTGVRCSGIGLRGATLLVDLRVENPNTFAIEIDSITVAFEASNPSEPGTWTPVTHGASREKLVIEGGGHATAAIPVELSYSDLGTPASAILDKGTLNYRINGEVMVREPSHRSTPFSKTGSVSLAGR
jgi:LEA14-like dessication related protein